MQSIFNIVQTYCSEKKGITPIYFFKTFFLAEGGYFQLDLIR